MISLHPVLGRLLALFILFAVLTGAYGFAVKPVIDNFARLDDAIAIQSDLLRRYQALGLSKEALMQELAKLRDENTVNAGVLPGRSEPLVGAELQNRLKTIVEQNDGKLGSVQILPGKEEGVFRKVTVRARISGSNEGVFNILYLIESAPPMLMIESLDLRAQRVRRKRGDTTEPQSLLNLGIDIAGYMYGDTK